MDGRRVRGEETRERVVAAALALFARQGYAATSMSQIAGAAGVRSQSIYHAFGSKEGLLAAAMDRAGEDFFHELGPAIAAGDPGRSIELVREIFVANPVYLRLHLVAILERQQSDAGLLKRISEVRRRGRLLAQQVLAPFVAQVPLGEQAQVVDDLSRLLMMLLDGAFIERQVNPDDDQFERLLKLIGAAMQGAALQLLGEAATGRDGAEDAL